MKKSTGKLLAGVLTGAAVGAVAGILLSPDKGSVIRKKIADKAKVSGENLKESVSGKFEEVKDYVSEKLEKKKHKRANGDGTAEYNNETAEPKTNG